MKQEGIWRGLNGNLSMRILKRSIEEQVLWNSIAILVCNSPNYKFMQNKTFIKNMKVISIKSLHENEDCGTRRFPICERCQIWAIVKKGWLPEIFRDCQGLLKSLYANTRNVPVGTQNCEKLAPCASVKSWNHTFLNKNLWRNLKK